MADTFGLKIGIEGEKEFKNALREINDSFKVLGSEMKLVDAQFDKNDKSAQALAARKEFCMNLSQYCTNTISRIQVRLE